MSKEILLYGQIYSYSSERFITTINELLEKDAKAELKVRVNTNGGDVDYAMGMINKFAEFPNKKSIVVDGKAQSMGLFFCAHTDDVVAYRSANFLLHRAHYPEWFEKSPELFTESRKAELADSNKKLRKALENKIDADLFQQIAKCSLDDVFSMDGIRDVFLTAEQAKKIGLVNKILDITAAKTAEIEATTIRMVAEYNGISKAATTNDNLKKHNTMDLQTIKAEHPELYAQILAIGATQSNENAQAWAHFASVDPEAVKAGIASGKPMTQLQIIEFAEKKSNVKALVDLKDETGDNKIKTAAEKDTEIKAEAAKKAESEEFWNNVSAMTGVKL